MILGVRCELDEICALLGHSAAFSGIITHRRCGTTYHFYFQVTNYHYYAAQYPKRSQIYH